MKLQKKIQRTLTWVDLVPKRGLWQPLENGKILDPDTNKTVGGSVMFDSGTPWTVARQAPLSMECYRQKYWEWIAIPFFKQFVSFDRIGQSVHMQI